VKVLPKKPQLSFCVCVEGGGFAQQMCYQKASATMCASPVAYFKVMCRIGQNHIYMVYIRYFGRKITKHTVIYGVYIQLWPTLVM
jgi:hypothetical protein